MHVGPFDGRKKRSRCVACSTSHIKCSNTLPCNHCQRRNLVCSYAPVDSKKQLILLGRGQTETTASFSQTLDRRPDAKKRPRRAMLEAPSVPSGPPLDSRLRSLHFFDIFCLQNDFTGKGLALGSEVQRLAGLHSSDFLMDAMVSLGCLQMIQLNHPGTSYQMSDTSTALMYYSKSVYKLRVALAAPTQLQAEPRHTVLWTTLLLGLFELMIDSTGDGWRQHIIHGTAKALEATGPAACHSGPDRNFFIQARIFEVCRSMLFNDQSFLATPEWLAASSEIRATEGVQNPESLDSILDIMLACSRLRVKVRDLVYGQASPDLISTTTYAEDLSKEAFALRRSLDDWRQSHYASSPVDIGLDGSPVDIDATDDHDSKLLSHMFFAATSIYLSGIFDYEIPFWNALGLDVASLSEADIQGHCRMILDSAHVAVHKTKLSPLVSLLPLRVAGARARDELTRGEIRKLLCRIQRGFSVASAISMELDELWTTSPLHVTTNSSDDPEIEGSWT